MKSTVLILISFLSFASRAESKFDYKKVKPKLDEYLGSFEACYLEGLKTDPKLAGKVVLHWDINESGLVEKAGVKSTMLENTKVENCLVDVVKIIKFSPVPANRVVRVHYPFIFGQKTDRLEQTE